MELGGSDEAGGRVPFFEPGRLRSIKMNLFGRNCACAESADNAKDVQEIVFTTGPRAK